MVAMTEAEKKTLVKIEWEKTLRSAVVEPKEGDITKCLEVLLNNGIHKATQAESVDTADVRDMDGFSDLSFTGRTMLKMGVAAMKKSTQPEPRPIATPLGSGSLRARERMEASIINVAGREGSPSIIEAALRNLEEDNFSIRDKLDAKGFANLPQRLIPDKAAWSIVLAEKGQVRFLQVCLLRRLYEQRNVAPEITADMVGGRFGLLGDEAVVQDTGQIQALEQALRRANDAPRWLRSMAQWHMVFDRFYILA